MSPGGPFGIDRSTKVVSRRVRCFRRANDCGGTADGNPACPQMCWGFHSGISLAINVTIYGMNDNDEFFTVKEVAEIFKLKPNAIYAPGPLAAYEDHSY